ncbi:MAG: hydroxyacid dehydrogenase [Ruminococcaceae bacterium]|nr:hydroxyacid dehydrogenase [Oscillospiraceae bacterium]
MKIVLLDRASIGEDTPLDILYNIGEVTVYDHSTPSEAVERAKTAEILVINKVKITRELLLKAKSLKLICIFATGYDNIDVASAKELGVAVCNVPGYSTESVALFTVATALSLCAHLTEYSDYVRSGEYTDSGVPNKLTPVYHEIGGKTWGIVGYGNIGKAVGRVASALGARVVACKRTPTDEVECLDIDTLCQQSDIITIHCPLNEDTRALINSDRISLMKSDVILVNEARGAVVDEKAVAEAIAEGKIGGFGCDVYSTEPFGKEHPFYNIKERKNVIFTPHAAWGSYESRKRCIEIIGQNINSYIEGKMLNRVDK